MTQNQRIYRHLKDKGSITQIEAFSEYGIMRLASRISDLKKMGCEITSITEDRTNRYGEKVHYSRYILKGGEPYASEVQK